MPNFSQISWDEWPQFLFKVRNIDYGSQMLTFRALALRQSDWRNCGLCVCFYAENGVTLLVGNMVKRKQE